jgi:sugar phosphate isomerase/epimerase
MENGKFSRRTFTKSVAIAGFGAAASPLMKKEKPAQQTDCPTGLKMSLMAYSFNKALYAGTMTLEDVIGYCAKTGFEGADITGYFFPGYPAAPPDNMIYNLKRKAFRNGIGISGMGVRTDFTLPDPEKRAGEKKVVKEWILVAEKLGSPSVRVFTGKMAEGNQSWEERAKWMAEDIRECAEFGKSHGVMIAIQNQNDFLKTADQIIKLLEMIGHDWAGAQIDNGSVRTPDPYGDIEKLAKYAISWQLKELTWINEKQVDTDFIRLVGIIKKSGYRGYLPIETLGEGDMALKAESHMKKVRAGINA